MTIFGFLASILMGISLGLIGGGGSILTVPILVYLFGQVPLDATTNSLFVVGTTALIGAFINAKKGNIAIKTGFLFALPSFVGVYIARNFLLPILPEVLISSAGVNLTKPLAIMILFAVLMVLASRAMIRSGGIVSSLKEPVVPPLISVVFKGFLVGCITGFVGAGGGFLIIPALVALLNLPMRIAVGTSLGIIAANSLFGFMISPHESIDWNLLLGVTGLGIFGIFIGQFYASKIDEKYLKKGFGFFVLTIGSLIILDQVARIF